MELGMKDIVDFSVLKFLSLSIVPVLYRTVVSGDPAVNLRRLAALRTYILFSVQIAVIPANGIGGWQRRIRQPGGLCNLAYQGSR